MFPVPVPSVNAHEVTEQAPILDVREQDERDAGGRSARAVAWLTGNGVDAVNLRGGMGAWVDAGRPMVSESDAAPVVR